ncbi:MAG: phospholipase D family protein [Desulfomonilaceae bacterium]
MTIPRISRSLFVSLLLVATAFGHGFCEELTLTNAPTVVCFSPEGQCSRSIIRAIDSAKTQILVQAYSFTSSRIAKALLKARKRGVNVEVILDKIHLTDNYSSATFLANSGIRTYVDQAHNIAHNKIMIIDSDTVVTGSFNFTRAADEQNAENVLIIKSAELAKLYLANWQDHRRHSEIFKSRR